MITSYAQALEDVVLTRALRHVEKGFWIDVGANHPYHHSVTKTFSERGWSGINIEPVSEWFTELVKDRPSDVNLNLAASSFDGFIELHEIAGTGLSTSIERFASRAQGFVQRTLTVPCRTLSSICREHVHEEIHFLKIDVEGAEQSVLEGCDFARFRPWIVVVEATEPLSSTQSHEPWEPILIGANYDFLLFDSLNRFYLASERAELKPALAFPADDYTRATDIWTRGAIEIENTQLKQRIETLEAEISGLRATLSTTPTNGIVGLANHLLLSTAAPSHEPHRGCDVGSKQKL
jgi:FkbM family methyltransferase